MPAPFQEHINKLIGINDDEYSKILPYITERSVPKKHNLLVEGKVCRDSYFVAKGCLRMFFVNDKGVEQTIQFALENWWLADYTSLSLQKPSGFYIQSVEASVLLVLDHAKQEEMLKEVPRMERYFRLVHQRAHAASQFRFRFFYEYSREKLYTEFVRQFPEFVQRIPQYLLASYLGFTPEYLSELRRKHIS